MRSVTWFAAAMLLLVSACARTGGGGVPTDPRPGFDERARQVAGTWATAVTNAAWRDAVVPLEHLTRPPRGLTDQQESAAGLGRFTTGADLGEAAPAGGGVIRTPDGARHKVRVLSARAAFGDMARTDTACPPPAPSEPPVSRADGVAGAPAMHNCTMLTVTGATWGTASLRTNRGAATVPAWLFQVADLAEPIRRVAVAPQVLAQPPEVAVPALSGSVPFVGSQGLTAAVGDQLAFLIGVGACQQDARALVYETPDVVVIGGDPGRATGDTCIGSLRYEPVTATLRSALGARPVVDVVTGRLLPAGLTNW